MHVNMMSATETKQKQIIDNMDRSMYTTTAVILNQSVPLHPRIGAASAKR